MALSFRSSSPETRIFIHRQEDGRQRVCRAERHSGERQWKLSLEHPDGQRWSASFNGDQNELPLAIGHLLESKQNEFVQAKARGDRPPAVARDTSIRVDMAGNELGAVVVR